jgi:predicted negative regulator of RcsB-dependent stress response
LAAALDEREKSVTYETIGNIAVAEGNLSDARDAYTKSMVIGQALSEADPNSASAKRDLSVSLNKLGDIAVAEGNLSDARDAFTKSMEIAQALSDADPNSASAKKDVIVSLAKLAQLTGDVVYWQQALPVVEGMAAAGQLSPADAWMLEDIRAKARGQ